MSASTSLLSGFTVAQVENTVKSEFIVRPVYPYWTSRRQINGVINEDENLIGDAKLELIIEGVMDDLKVWCDKEGISYDTWTDYDSTPIAIRRAATYATVAALYSRRTRTFQGRVIPTVAPVEITVKGDAEKAMNHWEDKVREMKEAYISVSGPDRFWVSTADQEPIFSLNDIPPTGGVRETKSWHEWFEEYGYPDEVEE